MMSDERFEYVAWFRDERLPPGDEDHEWPAVFIVEAPDQEAAGRWGDRLAARRALRAGETFISSSTSMCGSERVDARLPVVRFGQEVPDDVIGW